MGAGRDPHRLSDADVFGELLGNLAPESNRVFDHQVGDRFTFLDHLSFGDLPLGDAECEPAGATSTTGGRSLGMRSTDRHILEGLLGLAEATLAAMAVAMTVRAA